MASFMARISRVGCNFMHKIPSNSCIFRQNFKAVQRCTYSSTSKNVRSEYVIGHRTEVDPKRVEELRQEDFRDPRIEITDPNDPLYVNKGYYKDPKDDAFTSKVVLISLFSVVMSGLVFYLYYTPDIKGREWAKREAERIVARKEAEGTNVFINPDFVPLDKLIVPTDEEMEAVWNKNL